MKVFSLILIAVGCAFCGPAGLAQDAPAQASTQQIFPGYQVSDYLKDDLHAKGSMTHCLVESLNGQLQPLSIAQILADLTARLGSETAERFFGTWARQLSAVETDSKTLSQLGSSYHFLAYKVLAQDNFRKIELLIQKFNHLPGGAQLLFDRIGPIQAVMLADAAGGPHLLAVMASAFEKKRPGPAYLEELIKFAKKLGADQDYPLFKSRLSSFSKDKSDAQVIEFITKTYVDVRVPTPPALRAPYDQIAIEPNQKNFMASLPKELASFQKLRIWLIFKSKFDIRKNLDALKARVSEASNLYTRVKGTPQEKQAKLAMDQLREQLWRGRGELNESQVAWTLRESLHDLNREILLTGNPHKLSIGGEIDVITDRALVEVSTQRGFEPLRVGQRNKFDQLKDLLLNPAFNPTRKPVILYAPNFQRFAEMENWLSHFGFKHKRDYFFAKDLDELKKIHDAIKPGTRIRRPPSVLQ